MWVFVFFDLPTETKKEKKVYTQFRKKVMGYGFSMFQFSVYTRHCPSRENADVHINRIKSIVPENGHVGILCITDLQFGNMQIYYGGKKKKPESGFQQLELF